ncbi:small subunit ribosomal protein S20 [Parelusimicrobium proximum]|uniref:30S ribosomal protein S20 n=1 Tax=Parelusimicrobium proximum TaxID=3228953 RepID=UPI003D16B3B9
MAKLKTGRHTSAIKAQRQAVKRTSRNKGLLKTVKLTTKATKASATVKDGKAEENLKKASSALDKAAKKGTLHKKTAARKKSRLAKAVNKSKKA